MIDRRPRGRRFFSGGGEGGWRRALIAASETGQVGGEVAEFVAGEAVGEARGHEGADIAAGGDGVAAEGDDRVGEVVVEGDGFLGFAAGVALVDIAGAGFDFDGVEALLHLLLGIEDGAEDELDRLGRAEGAEVGADTVGGAVDGVAIHAGQFGAVEDIAAGVGLAGGADRAGEVGDVGEGGWGMGCRVEDAVDDGGESGVLTS